MKKFLLFFLSITPFLGQAQLAAWNFQAANDVPSTDALPGTPALSIIGTLGTADYTTAGTNASCTQGTAPADISRNTNGWDANDAYRFTFNTTGFGSLVFSFCTRSSNTLVGTFKVRVSTDAAIWTDVVAAFTPAASTAWTSISTGTLAAAYDNQATLYIEIFKVTTADLATRTVRLDNVILNGTALPIELAAFKATKNSQVNQLNWQTATEINAQNFEIERSQNAQNWQTIGSVAAAGNSNEPKNYAFDDRQPLPKAFYRLKMIDLDGKFEYSNALFVERKGQKTVVVSPNPTADQALVAWSSDAENSIIIETIDIIGRVVSTQNIDQQKGENSTTLDLSTLPTGRYFVRFNNSGETVAIDKN